MISGFLTVRAVRIKAKTYMLTTENTVLVGGRRSFQELALSISKLRDASPATLCSVTWRLDEDGEQEQLIGKPNIYVGVEIGY